MKVSFVFFSAFGVELLDINAVEDVRIPADDCGDNEDEKKLGVTFSPPLYLQRYYKVLDILSEQRWVHAINRVVGSNFLRAIAQWIKHSPVTLAAGFRTWTRPEIFSILKK